MDQFQEIFTPPALPTPEHNPREYVLNQIQSMEDGDRWDARAQHFMNQFQAENRSKERMVDIQEQLVDILHKVLLQWILQIQQISR